MALTNEQVETMKRAVMRYLETDEKQSTHLLAKRLNNEFKAVLEWHQIDDARARWRSRRAQRLANQVLAIPSKVYATPECTNCGGDHFVSQCPSPFPEKAEKPQPIRLEVEAPTTEVTEEQTNMDLSAASVAPQNHAEMQISAPHPDSRRRTTAGMMMRRQYVNELLDGDPSLHPLVILGKVRERFGIGLDWRYIYDTCRVAREVHNLPQIPPHEISKSRSGGGEPLPEYPVVQDDSTFADTPDEECLWLAQQANDIMRVHGLTELRLTVDGGKAKWVYKVVTTGEGEVSL